MVLPDTDPECTVWKHLRGIRRVVINSCHGGFSLSHAAILRYHELQGQTIHWRPSGVGGTYVYYRDPEDPQSSAWWEQDIARDDPYLVRVVQEMGGKDAGGAMAMLKIVEIPESVPWCVQDYDGNEWVAEQHRIWS